jgi:predicted HTH transcriptional regulator
MTAVFEAIVNPVAHRDYGHSESRIHLKLFARLELISPSATAPDVFVSPPMPHNEVLTRLLSQCPTPPDWAPSDRMTLMGGREQGVSIIGSGSERLCSVAPSYRGVNEAKLQLTIYAAPTESPQDRWID